MYILLLSILITYTLLIYIGRLRLRNKLSIPRSKIVYYECKEYKYKMNSFFFTFLGDFSVNKCSVKIYQVNRKFNIPFKRHIITTPKYYLDGSELRNLNHFQEILRFHIHSSQNKNEYTNWDGCLDEKSRAYVKRMRNINAVIDV